MIKLVLVRHGQSVWNLENKFTGWTDVELSEKGIEEAKEAGRILKEKGFRGEIKWQYFNVISRSSAEGKAAALSLQPLTVLLPG